MTGTNPLRPKLFAFLRDLEANNDRAWFKENQSRYERDVREPALEFVNAFAPHLERISPHFVADSRPVGGSLFRIHRDLRFSKDKTPYKTHTGIQFRHESFRDAHAPGFYLHLEPASVFLGIGLWHPDTATAGRIRGAIAAEPTRWKRATRSKKFTDVFELSGDTLKRPPKGFDDDHPLIEDLKRKDFIAVATQTQRDVTRPDFVDEFAAMCKAGGPFMRFLCAAVGVPY